MKRILVVSVNWLGDSLLITPVFKALKRSFPSSFIAVMAVERVKDVFISNPYIDEVIVFDERTQERGFISKRKFIKRLKNRKFDTVFLIHRSFTRALICLLAGIRERIGYARLKNLFILTQRITPPRHNPHRQDYYFYLFEKAGIAIEDKTLSFFIPAKVREKMNTALGDLKRKHPFIAGINPSANWALKKWPEEYFSLLSDKLIEEGNCAVIFVGADKDKETVDKVMKGMKRKAYNFCARTNLKELGALMESLHLFISNDSGPAHLAGGLGIPTLVLFGPTSPQVTAPRGRVVEIVQKPISCPLPCYNLQCRNSICMKNIKVKEVLGKAKKLLSH